MTPDAAAGVGGARARGRARSTRVARLRPLLVNAIVADTDEDAIDEAKRVHAAVHAGAGRPLRRVRRHRPDQGLRGVARDVRALEGAHRPRADPAVDGGAAHRLAGHRRRARAGVRRTPASTTSSCTRSSRGRRAPCSGAGPSGSPPRSPRASPRASPPPPRRRSRDTSARERRPARQLRPAPGPPRRGDAPAAAARGAPAHARGAAGRRGSVRALRHRARGRRRRRGARRGRRRPRARGGDPGGGGLRPRSPSPTTSARAATRSRSGSGPSATPTWSTTASASARWRRPSPAAPARSPRRARSWPRARPAARRR